MTTSHRLRSPDGNLFTTASSQPIPPTAKKARRWLFHCLTRMPTRFSELNARIGEPRCMVEAIKPIPINTHSPNMLIITPLLLARKFALHQRQRENDKAPATH